MERFAVCEVAELPPGARKLITAAGRSIGVFNVDGELYALRNVCPHRSAPICLGTLAGTMLPSEPGEFEYGLDGLILRCPWHAWEFDIRTGESYLDPVNYRVKTYPTEIENGVVFVHVGS
jgi:3-phenylpropionate/trans-cinnamate dioxygenase ferredoxin subunit